MSPHINKLDMNMTRVKTIQLEWKYSPENYLEESISILFEGGCLDICNGIALAAIDPLIFQNIETLQGDLSRTIESRFSAVQIMTHKDYELSKPSRTDIQEDGRKHHHLSIKSTVSKMRFQPADLIVKDKDGNIVSDTKKERLDKQKWFASMLEAYRYTDITLDQMLKSYKMSVKDPGNELVRLYEIRDSLSKKFGSKKISIAELNITNNEWDDIGELSNNRPLNQGRHRGKSVGLLRDAESTELNTARELASNLIEKYLMYLEQH